MKLSTIQILAVEVFHLPKGKKLRLGKNWRLPWVKQRPQGYLALLYEYKSSVIT